MQNELTQLRKTYRTFTEEAVTDWAKLCFGDWMENIQGDEKEPVTPAEKFYRYYTQGIHYMFNGGLRRECTDEHFEEIGLSKQMISDSIREMKPCPDNIVTYRFIDEHIMRLMRNGFLCRGSVLSDKGFMSTTLTPKSSIVRQQHFYKKRKYELEIYVPAGTPCAFLEFISGMNENELILPPRTKLRVLSVKRFRIKPKIICIVER